MRRHAAADAYLRLLFAAILLCHFFRHRHIIIAIRHTPCHAMMLYDTLRCGMAMRGALRAAMPDAFRHAAADFRAMPPYAPDFLSSIISFSPPLFRRRRRHY